MGLIGGFLRTGGARAVGEAVGGVAEVFVGNRADRDAAATRQVVASVSQFGGEFAQAAPTRFDSFVNGLNRLPRPMLALGTFGLFGYAMVEPEGFSIRMTGLGLVPEPLWWLLGAIVSFYFGARELHHQRARTTVLPPSPVQAIAAPEPVALAAPPIPAAIDPDHNAAVEEWRRRRS